MLLRGNGHSPLATAVLLFPPFGRGIVLLLAQKKVPKEKGTRVSGGCAVPSPLPMGNCRHGLTNTGMETVGARRAVPGSFPRPPFRHSREIPAYAGMTGNPVPCGNDGKGMDLGAQAVILRGAVRRVILREVAGRRIHATCGFRVSASLRAE